MCILVEVNAYFNYAEFTSSLL